MSGIGSVCKPDQGWEPKPPFSAPLPMHQGWVPKAQCCSLPPPASPTPNTRIGLWSLVLPLPATPSLTRIEPWGPMLPHLCTLGSSAGSDARDTGLPMGPEIWELGSSTTVLLLLKFWTNGESHRLDDMAPWATSWPIGWRLSTLVLNDLHE